MKLTYLEQELNPNKEHELISKNDFGFNVNIKYIKDSHYTANNESLYNCTEVHHLWSIHYMGGPSTAFESDIHKTGFTRRIDTIESVNIELADKIYDKYRVFNTSI